MSDAIAPDVRPFLNAALAHLLRNEFDPAERLLAQALSESTNDCDALHLFGQMRRVQKRFSEAEDYYRRALSVEPERAELHHHLGQLLILTGRLDEAGAALREAIRLKPNFADAHLELGRLHASREENSEAESSYRKALRVQPNLVAGKLALTAVLIALKRAKEAETLARSTLALIRPQSEWFAALQQNLAIAISEQGRHEEALARFAQLETIAPGLPNVHFNRGNTLQGMGRLEDAEEAYRAAVSREPLDLKAHQSLSQLLYRLGRTDFLSSYDGAMASRPEHFALPLEKAKLLFLAGRHEEAREYFTRALALSPGSVAATNGLASTLARLGEFADAIRTFDGLTRGRPQDAQVRCSYAECLLRARDWDTARAQAEEALSQDPNDQLALGLWGLSLRGLDDPREQVLNDATLVQTFELEAPRGFTSMDDFNTELEAYIAHLHLDVREHINQTSRLGTKTIGTLFGSGHVLVDGLRQRIDDAVHAYIERMKDNPLHPLFRRRTSSFSYWGSWSTRLRDGGYHTNHVHPRGWISSAYYVNVPDVVNDDEGQQGWLKFDEAPFDIGTTGAARKAIKPRAGLLVLFPSYMWHGTVPFHSDGVRTTIAFDAIPDAG